MFVDHALVKETDHTPPAEHRLEAWAITGCLASSASNYCLASPGTASGLAEVHRLPLTWRRGRSHRQTQQLQPLAANPTPSSAIAPETTHYVAGFLLMHLRAFRSQYLHRPGLDLPHVQRFVALAVISPRPTRRPGLVFPAKKRSLILNQRPSFKAADGSLYLNWPQGGKDADGRLCCR